MRTFKQYLQLLREGGNMFSDVRINKSEVLPTVKSLEQLTGLKLTDCLLGSTGKSPTSGDIDLVIDENEVNKDAFIQKLLSKGVSPQDLRKTGIEVAYRAPIIDARGNKTGNHIQVDFMFHPDPMYLRFYYANNEQLPYKGAHRNITMSALAKDKGLTLSMKGLFDRATKQLVTKEPREIAQHILGKDATDKDLYNIPAIMKYLLARYTPEQVKALVGPAEETTGVKLL